MTTRGSGRLPEDLSHTRYPRFRDRGTLAGREVLTLCRRRADRSHRVCKIPHSRVYPSPADPARYPGKADRSRLEAFQLPAAGKEPAGGVRETLPVHPLPGDRPAPLGRRTGIRVLEYDACGGREHFISMVSDDSLIGFARLRFPSMTYRPELENAALMRELHVYGSLVPVGKDAESEEWQHRQYGKSTPPPCRGDCTGAQGSGALRS